MSDSVLLYRVPDKKYECLGSSNASPSRRYLPEMAIHVRAHGNFISPRRVSKPISTPCEPSLIFRAWRLDPVIGA